MALTLRASASKAAIRKAPRTAVRPVAAMNAAQATKVAGAAVASLAVAASLVAPAEAHNVISTVASATEGYPFVPPSWAPSVFVPLTGLVLPAVAMGSLFVYIEKEAPEK